jgi:hypothetical protein
VAVVSTVRITAGAELFSPLIALAPSRTTITPLLGGLNPGRSRFAKPPGIPAVLYVGTAGNFIQCQHGGMEPGFDPRALLDSPHELAFQFLGALNQRQFLDAHPEWISPWTDASRNLIRKVLQDFRPEDPISPAILGFMWNDFSVLANEPEFSVDPGRAYVYGLQASRTLQMLRMKRVTFSFRARRPVRDRIWPVHLSKGPLPSQGSWSRQIRAHCLARPAVATSSGE